MGSVARGGIWQTRGMLRGWSGLLFAGVLLACESTPADPDAGVATDPDAGAAAVAPPAPPDHGDCPEGWRAVTVSGASVCDPWPETGVAASCAVDQAHFVGGAGCERVGTTCGADGFADDLPAAGVLFVRPGASGDGTRASPFGAIADAVAVASAGTTIALSVGVFAQDEVDLPDGVVLRGACAAETVLHSDADGIETFLGVVTVRGTGGSVENLRIEGARPGVSVNGGSVTLRDVVVAEAVGQGVLVLNGGALTAERLVVRDTQPYMGFAEGVGLQVNNGSSATIDRAVFARNRIAGVSASGMGTVVTITDAAAQQTMRAVGSDTLGIGFGASNGARLELTRVAVDGASYAGIRALAGATTIVHRAVVRDVEQAANITDLGAGVAAEAGTLEASELWIERASHTGAVAVGTGTSLTLRDALVLETRVAPEPMPDVFGLGVWASDDADLALERVLVEGNTFAGVLIQTGSRGVLRDLTVRETRGRPMDGSYGRGLEIIDAAVTLERGLFERNHDASLTAYRAGATLDATDVAIRDTLPTADGRFGYAVQLAAGASMTFDGFDAGGSHGHGVFAIGAGTRITASRARIADVTPFACASMGCVSEPFAYGAAAVDRALVDLRQFSLERAGDVALQLAGGEADLMDGEIADTPVAFNVQTPGFDESRLRGGVRLRSVATEIDHDVRTVGVEIPPFGISLD